MTWIKKTASVLFDMTLINGTNSNRYIKGGECVEGSFVTTSFGVVTTLDERIKKILYTLYKKHDCHT